ncbi:MAG TPA: L-threonine 3-dehydrogenase [Rhabdochlamydiaceae bacterium]|nr:L-threonine 3-dehydrogenase [Rhabdochlamydiaceae bacterium]
MKALGKLKKEPGIWLYDAPKPVIGPTEVLIKVKRTAICGTDLHIYKWDEWAQKTIPVPITTGHEFFGIIEEVGKDVKGLKPGDRVAGEGHLVCGICRNCRAGRGHLCRNTKGIGVNTTGCFAEYIAMPASNAYLLPPEISDMVASFLDPLGNAVHTTLSFDLVGEDVLVTGAGPIGIMCALIAHHVGARKVVITDVNEYRLNLARKMGLKHCENITKVKLTEVMKKLKIVEGFDIALENSGSPAALQQILDVINFGGKVALLGILPKAEIEWSKVIFKSLILKGIYGREMYETWYKMIALLQSGLEVEGIATHIFKADDYQKAFDVIQKGECGKVVLDWD